MTNTKSTILTLFLFASLPTFAYQPKEGQVSAQLGAFMTQTDFNNSHISRDRRFEGGTGLIVNGDIDDKSSLELTLFNMYKTYYRKEGTQVFGQKTALIHIGMGYRWWHSSKYSTSLSFYSAYANGNIQNVYSDFPIGSEIKTSAQDDVEYGFDLAAQAEVYEYMNYAFVVDTRYALSLTNKTKESGNHFGLFLGIRFPVQ